MIKTTTFKYTPVTNEPIRTSATDLRSIPLVDLIDELQILLDKYPKAKCTITDECIGYNTYSVLEVTPNETFKS